ncbi:hypothetical protein BDQ17DRAFT_1409907 [Cyathus striatus]|nr:hypothetical protein BDQ17DRAFT_1409907 [Cyathus striatus]
MSTAPSKPPRTKEKYACIGARTTSKSRLSKTGRRGACRVTGSVNTSSCDTCVAASSVDIRAEQSEACRQVDEDDSVGRIDLWSKVGDNHLASSGSFVNERPYSGKTQQGGSELGHGRQQVPNFHRTVACTKLDDGSESAGRSITHEAPTRERTRAEATARGGVDSPIIPQQN